MIMKDLKNLIMLLKHRFFPMDLGAIHFHLQQAGIGLDKRKLS